MDRSHFATENLSRLMRGLASALDINSAQSSYQAISDAAVEVLDSSFANYRIFNVALERLASRRMGTTDIAFARQRSLKRSPSFSTGMASHQAEADLVP